MKSMRFPLGNLNSFIRTPSKTSAALYALCINCPKRLATVLPVLAATGILSLIPAADNVREYPPPPPIYSIDNSTLP
ncbi:hypothetical protein D3C72_1890520 [compost metagenome]